MEDSGDVQVVAALGTAVDQPQQVASAALYATWAWCDRSRSILPKPSRCAGRLPPLRPLTRLGRNATMAKPTTLWPTHQSVTRKSS